MKQNYFSVVLLLLSLIMACNLPTPEKTISMMEQYWQFYKVENYDSLKVFYIHKGDNPEENEKALFNALHNLHENYGNVKSINLIEQSASSSTSEGDKIELTYEVEFEKKVINNKFSFKKDGNNMFKIMDHSFNQ